MRREYRQIRFIGKAMETWSSLTEQLSKGLATNPGQALDCGQLIPTNLLMYPQDEIPLPSQELFIDFPRQMFKYGTHSLKLDVLQRLQGGAACPCSSPRHWQEKTTRKAPETREAW